MKSNSNLRITGFTVDPTSQEITSLEVNGTTVSGSADLENNKTATINVSTYTEPVEVTPTSGKDGMKKATITLSSIPVVPTVRSSLVSDALTAEVVTDNTNFTQATVFYFTRTDGESDPGTPLQDVLTKIEPTSITSNSFVYQDITWTVRIIG